MKIEEQRPRVIWAAALEDQLVDRWYHYIIVSAQCDSPKGCRVGWNPVPDGFLELELSFDGDVLNIDARAFDWTIPPWALRNLVLWVLEQNPLLTEQQRVAIMTRFDEVFGTRCVVRLPDGRRYRQKRWGIMKSGNLWTIILNSAHQLGVYSLALYRMGLPWLEILIWAMGDDVLMQWRIEWSSEDLRRQLIALGQLIKRIGKERDFAGYRFHGKGVVEPLYERKHMFVLGHATDDFQVIVDAYRLVYALSKNANIVPWLDRHSTLTKTQVDLWAKGLVKGLVAPPNAHVRVH